MIERLKNRLLFLLVAQLCATVAFAADTEVSAPSDTLEFWSMDNGVGSRRALRKLVKKFQRETGITVVVRTLEWGEGFETISKALSSADAPSSAKKSSSANASSDSSVRIPDILQLGSTWVPHFASQGMIREMDSVIEQMDSTRFYSEAFRAGHVGDGPKVYSFPWFLDVRALFANEWLWHSLEIQESDVETFPKFVGTLRAINSGNLKNSEMHHVAAFALPGKDDWTGPQQMSPYIWSAGGDFVVKRDGGYRSFLLDSATLSGIAMYVKILGDANLSPNGLQENSEQIAARFANSELLMHYGTSDLIRLLEYPEKAGGLKSSAIADDGILIVPYSGSVNAQFTFVGGSHLAFPVLADSSRRASAERLLFYLLRSDNIDVFCRAVGFIPSDRGLIRIWMQDHRYSQLIKNLENGKSFPNIPEWGTVENVLIKMCNDIGTVLSNTNDAIKRRQEVADILIAADKKINEVLGYVAKADAQALKPWIESVLSAEVPEITPGNLRFNLQASPFPVWRVAATVAGLLLLGLIYCCVRLVTRLVRDRNAR